MKIFGKLILVGVAIFAVLQLDRPGIPTKPATAELDAPIEVRQILEKDCYSCHSDQRRLSWFDQIVPAYWLVRHDILTAREHLNFSTLGSKPPAVQKATIYEAVNMIQLGAMPLSNFVKLHPEAKVTPEELATLKAYLSPWKPLPAYQNPLSESTGTKTDDARVIVAAAPNSPIFLTTVRPEFNGIPFDASFENWKPISTTDRGDNNTFRFILGNDIAIKAVQSGNISPWPDGTRFAKIAWQQELGPDGLVHPAKFVQVELMIKDAQLYKNTDGWGWGRWRGLDMKPYGQDGRFVNECTGCHLPVRGNDYVYTLPITSIQAKGNEVVNNNAAALPVSLPYQPLGWRAITMYVDPKTRTTATLYGNDAAIAGMDAQGQTPPSGPPGTTYSAGAVLALVTWAQREDPHWFGARIPDAPESIEFVSIAAIGRSAAYQRFAGAGLIEEHPSVSEAAQRLSFIVGLAPVRLP